MSVQLDTSVPCSSSLGISCLSKHALLRMQQRGVSPETLNWLLSYGQHFPDHKGCSVVTFDDDVLDELSTTETAPLKGLGAGARKLYAVVNSDGLVVTTGHRFRRIPRDLSLSAYRPGRSRSPKAQHNAVNAHRH